MTGGGLKCHNIPLKGARWRISDDDGGKYTSHVCRLVYAFAGCEAPHYLSVELAEPGGRKQPVVRFSAPGRQVPLPLYGGGNDAPAEPVALGRADRQARPAGDPLFRGGGGHAGVGRAGAGAHRRQPAGACRGEKPGGAGGNHHPHRAVEH